MVVRHDKRKRKYFGTRRWGVGNIKNARGKGGKGGTGKAGRKHKFTYINDKHPELIKTVGFGPWNRKRMREITIKEIERRLASS
jgi:ribosomal protein L15